MHGHNDVSYKWKCASLYKHPLAPAHAKLIPRDSCTDSCKLHVSPIADTMHFSSCNQRRLLRKRGRKKERVNQKWSEYTICINVHCSAKKTGKYHFKCLNLIREVYTNAADEWNMRKNFNMPSIWLLKRDKMWQGSKDLEIRNWSRIWKISNMFNRECKLCIFKIFRKERNIFQFKRFFNFFFSYDFIIMMQ